MIKLNLYKNKNSNSTNYGKIYGRVDTPKMLDIDDLAEHMAEHGTVYTIDIIAGVLKGVARCIREKVLDGYSVKLDDLCIFTPPSPLRLLPTWRPSTSAPTSRTSASCAALPASPARPS